MVLQRLIYQDQNVTNRNIIVFKDDNYYEVRLVNKFIESEETTENKGGEVEAENKMQPSAMSLGTHLLVLMPDMSGSMFNYRLFQPLLTEMVQVAKEALTSGHEVVFIPWGKSAAYHEITLTNVDTILFQEVDENHIRRKGRNRAPNDFPNDNWFNGTYPRVGFERFEEVLNNYKERKQLLSSVNLWFSTDGEFSKQDVNTPATWLTDAYLRDLKQHIANVGIPFSMVYLGIQKDKVPDAQRILDVFPFTHYDYAVNAAAIKPKCVELAPHLKLQVASGANVLITIDGEDKLVSASDTLFSAEATQLHIKNGLLVSTSEIDNKTQVYFVGVRKQLLAIRKGLGMLETQLLQQGTSILAPLIQYDSQLTQIAQALQKQSHGGSDAKETREYLNTILRQKNGLQQQAAQQVHSKDIQDARYRLTTQQNLLMNRQDKFHIDIAKQITRNRTRKQDYQIATLVKPAVGGNIVDTMDSNRSGVDFTNTVTFADGSVKQYFSLNVPENVANDTEIDFITTEEWKQVYENGDCRSQCILLVSKPNPEGNFHSPSTIAVQSTMCQISLNTVYDNIAQQVQVQSYDSIFVNPFTGYPSSTKYNAVLPTWSPNLKVNVLYSLKPLLGYIIAGHELGYPNRALDIYIPACMDLWRQYVTSADKPNRLLNDALLLTLAFIRAKEWTKLGNPSDPKAITAAKNVELFLEGDTGTNAFSTVWEPILYSLFVPLSSEQRAKLESLVIAEATYKLAHRKGDSLYPDIIVPLVREIIEETKLKETPDFVQLPEFKATEKMDKIITAKVLDDKTRGFWLVAQQLIAIGGKLTRDNCQAWKYAEDNFQVADSLNGQLKEEVLDKMSEYKGNTVELIERLVVANDFPSNSQRSKLAACTSKTPRDVLRDRVKQILAGELGEEEKDRYFRNRFDKIKQTHSGYPLIWNAQSANWIAGVNGRGLHCEHFVAQFFTHFDIQLRQEYLFFQEIHPTWEEFSAQVKLNLERLWNDVDTRDNLRLIGFSRTYLPKLRCGHVLCNQFLKFDPVVENTHWLDLGADIPRGSKYRLWVPSMHVQMENQIRAHKNSQADFVFEMLRYAMQFADPQLKPHFEKYYAWYWKNQNSVYCSENGQARKAGNVDDATSRQKNYSYYF